MTSNKLILIDLDHTLYNVKLKKLNPDSLSFIKYAQKAGRTILFTEGDLNFQTEKVVKLELDKIFRKNIRIYQEFSKMVKGIEEFVDDEVVIIDDKPDVIDKAVDLGWTTIRVRRGRYKDEETQKKPTYEVANLKAIVDNNLI